MSGATDAAGLCAGGGPKWRPGRVFVWLGIPKRSGGFNGFNERNIQLVLGDFPASHVTD